MLNTNLLWTRIIDPVSGRIEKRETFLGATLAFLSILIVATAIFLIFF